MEKLTISEISEKIASITSKDDPFLKVLREDKRKGVEQLVKRWENNYIKNKQLKSLFEKMSTIENKLRLKGCNLIAGIDEVGRGPLAGPVVAAAVILPENFQLLGLNDSKALSQAKREQFFNYIKNEALQTSVGIIEAEQIDKINIYEATKLAMIKAVENLQTKPDHLLIDAMELQIDIGQTSVIKGDANSISIAAASIIAKVTRDRIMCELGRKYPQYKFETNMGYGTKEHLLAIEQYGITPYHRKSFAPIKNNYF